MENLSELSHKQILKIDKDYTLSAEAANLTYVSDKDPGISRKKKGDGFIYTNKGKPVKDTATLDRIKKLAIPPAWSSVWICPDAAGHIQATGLDQKARKQYRYHQEWQTLRNQTKFHRLYEFGKLLPSIRMKVEEDIVSKTMNEDKVLATVISLMERTHIRVGNNDYEKKYGTYGLTTLKDSHVKVAGGKAVFSFKGKKGIHHDIPLDNPRLAKLVKQCKEIPGKELFQFYDADGKRHPIDSGMVNRYIKEASGKEFTAKDFRTWAGTLHILASFRSVAIPTDDATCKKNILAALDEVSHALGNTRTVCKKYYVHPGIIKMYEDNSLHKYLKELDDIEKPDNRTALATQEKVLMKILGDLV